MMSVALHTFQSELSGPALELKDEMLSLRAQNDTGKGAGAT